MPDGRQRDTTIYVAAGLLWSVSFFYVCGFSAELLGGWGSVFNIAITFFFIIAPLITVYALVSADLFDRIETRFGSFKGLTARIVFIGLLVGVLYFNIKAGSSYQSNYLNWLVLSSFLVLSVLFRILYRWDAYRIFGFVSVLSVAHFLADHVASRAAQTVTEAAPVAIPTTQGDIGVMPFVFWSFWGVTFAALAFTGLTPIGQGFRNIWRLLGAIALVSGVGFLGAFAIDAAFRHASDWYDIVFKVVCVVLIAFSALVIAMVRHNETLKQEGRARPVKTAG